MSDPGELPLSGHLTLAETGLKLLVDESGTSLEFVCADRRSLRVRINDLGAHLSRHEAEILRIWSAEQQARRKL
jgi:hypothetical protein